MALGSHPTKSALEQIVPEVWVAGGTYGRGQLGNDLNSDSHGNGDMDELHDEAKQIAFEELLEYVDSDIGSPVNHGSKRGRDWPEGYVGSVTDKRSVILAAMAKESDIESLGIDLELNEKEGDALDYIVGRDEELPPSIPEKLALLAAFSTKEAVFKAYYQLEESVIDFGDITLEWKDDDSTTNFGFATCPHKRGFSIRCLDVNEWVVAAAIILRE
jgi:4'-phosphopantetheinyl transferase EntD